MCNTRRGQNDQVIIRFCFILWIIMWPSEGPDSLCLIITDDRQLSILTSMYKIKPAQTETDQFLNLLLASITQNAMQTLSHMTG